MEDPATHRKLLPKGCAGFRRKLQDADFSSPPPPHPSVSVKAAAGDPATVRSMGKRPSCPSDAPKCSGVGGRPKASFQSRSGRARAIGGPTSCPAAQKKILSISCAGLPSSRTPALPAGLPLLYLQQSQARPRSALQNLNPYCGLPPSHPPPPACGALEPASRLRWPWHNRYRLQRVWSPDGAEWAVCGQTLGPGGGSVEAKPALVARPPSVRRCLHARVVGGGEQEGDGRGRM